MGHLAAAFILVLLGAGPALTAELPSRKAGLWELKLSLANREAPSQTVRQCIDAATDQMMQASAGAFGPGACAERDVQLSANGITIDSTCTVAGKTSTTHSVLSGSVEGAYTMSVMSSEAWPGGSTSMTMSAQWLGPCAADQRPGDMIMGNGVKMNLLDLQQRGTQIRLTGEGGAPR